MTSSLIVRDAPLHQVLSLVAQTQGLNVVSAENIDSKVSVTLHSVPLEEALKAEFARGKKSRDSGVLTEGARRFSSGAGRHGSYEKGDE